jgi:ribonuclease VapC
MVIDTSAIMAILLQEPGAETYARRIEEAEIRFISSLSILEAGMVVEARSGALGARDLDLFLMRAQMQVMPFDEEQASLARDAFRRFGKGRHPAGLNLCDCAVYALSKST